MVSRESRTVELMEAHVRQTENGLGRALVMKEVVVQYFNSSNSAAAPESRRSFHKAKKGRGRDEQPLSLRSAH